jgi:hypothetical protein
MSSFPLMDTPFEVSEQIDGFTTPLDQYESFEASDVVSDPSGPMWWSPGDADPTYVGDIVVTENFPGGIIEINDDAAYAITPGTDDIIEVL